MYTRKITHWFARRSFQNRIFLLMHAMGPNVAGVIGSAIAAGVMLKYVLAM